MDAVSGFGSYALSFVVVLSVLVFVHELGHYLVARWNGVRVEAFSIGFGPRLFGFTDRAGTQWKVSAIPLGGFVKMYGDAGPASTPSDAVRTMTAEERKVSFFYKNVWQRIAIVAAGPLANFIFAIAVLAGLFMAYGQPYTPATIGQVMPDTAAAAAGLQPGDTVLSVDGRAIDRFEALQQIVRINPGQPMELVVERGGQRLELTATPRVVENTDSFGNVFKVGQLGVGVGGQSYRQYGPLEAIWRAVVETWNIIDSTFETVGQMFAGDRGTEELGGPLRIAQMSGQMAQAGIIPYISFAAILSINLGLINLFPIPLLDGGHLLFYFFEAVRGRPLGERTQEYGFRIGLALVLSLMIFTTWNDLVWLRWVNAVKELF